MNMPAPTMPRPASMPAPKAKPVTFGDKRPVKATMPSFIKRDRVERRLKDGAKPLPEIQSYRQTNGSLYLTRFNYNRVWITGTGENEQQALYNARQFYMHETAQGRADSEEIENV